jgi:hypothetical protein
LGAYPHQMVAIKSAAINFMSLPERRELHLCWKIASNPIWSNSSGNLFPRMSAHSNNNLPLNVHALRVGPSQRVIFAFAIFARVRAPACDAAAPGGYASGSCISDIALAAYKTPEATHDRRIRVIWTM